MCYNIYIVVCVMCHVVCSTIVSSSTLHSPQHNGPLLQTGSLHLPHSIDGSIHTSLDRSIGYHHTTCKHPPLFLHRLHLMTEDWRRHININRNPLHTITNTLPYASRSKSSRSRVNNNYGKSSTLIIILHTYVYHDGNISISIRYILFNYLLGRM